MRAGLRRFLPSALAAEGQPNEEGGGKSPASARVRKRRTLRWLAGGLGAVVVLAAGGIAALNVALDRLGAPQLADVSQVSDSVLDRHDRLPPGPALLVVAALSVALWAALVLPWL